MTEELPESTGLGDLSIFSARIGSDPMLVQGAGGNTSIKDGEIMWIKASGTCLSDANEKRIFVPVDLLAMQTAILDGKPEADRPIEFMLGEGVLRPSIETSLHAIFDQAVVVHVHCVKTLAHAVCADARQVLARKLEGLNWSFAAYTKPGVKLANEVRRRLAKDTNIVVLGNHGLIVAAESVAGVDVLLREVSDRLTLPKTAHLEGDLTALAARIGTSDYAPSDDPEVHGIAMVAGRVEAATRGSLYPDHVIFCGIAATVLADGETAADAETKALACGLPAPVFLLAPGQGVLVRSDASGGTKALLRCLADVLARLPEDADLIYLNDQQNRELLNWDAEKYRRAMNA